MSLVAQLVAQLRAIQAVIDDAGAASTAARDRFDEPIETVRAATDGTSNPAPGEAIVRWQAGQVHLDGAVAQFQAAKAAIEDYIGSGLGFTGTTSDGGTGGGAGATTPVTPKQRTPAPAPTPLPKPTFTPAGLWRSPPKRHHDSKKKTVDATFNADYEYWVKTSNGGPHNDHEYLVQGNGKQAFFDARRIDMEDGKRVETLIDAKGRYDQFLDPKTPGKFEKWWTAPSDTGLKKMIKVARRQVIAADGCPVEWWCAQRASAAAFREAIKAEDDLVGKIRVIYRPMRNN